MSAELECCIDELAPRALRYAASLVGNWQQAEDLTQDALAALVHCWQSNGPPTHPAGFVLTMIRRRAARQWLVKQASEPLERVASWLSGDDDPHRRLHSVDRLARARHTLARLPRAARRTLALRVSGFSLGEIASLEGCSVPAVKMRLHRARQALLRSEAASHVPGDFAAVHRNGGCKS